MPSPGGTYCSQITNHFFGNSNLTEIIPETHSKFKVRTSTMLFSRICEEEIINYSIDTDLLVVYFEL